MVNFQPVTIVREEGSKNILRGVDRLSTPNYFATLLRGPLPHYFAAHCDRSSLPSTTNPMETRSSPRKGRSGKPPLPTRAGKAGNKGKKKATKKAPAKAPAKVAAAAKQAVAELDGQVYIKPDPEVNSAGNYTSDEDLYLSKAWVSVSTDPIVGANQKGETFWKGVHKKMYILYQEEADVVIMSKRSWESIKNRFQKTIHPTVQKYNAYYKQAVEKNQSGWTKEMYIAAASKVWLQMEGRPFKFELVIRILHQAPKYNPMIEENDEEEGNDGDKKPKASAVGKIMGSNMERPIGNKKAKAQRALEGIEQGSLASTQAVEAMAKSSAAMASIMAKRQRHDSWSKRAELYMKMGNEAKALEMLQMMEEDDQMPAAKLPKTITITGQEEEEQHEPQTMTFKSAPGALDSDDDSDESEHPSQPSDDSRAAKNSEAV